MVRKSKVSLVAGAGPVTRGERGTRLAIVAAALLATLGLGGCTSEPEREGAKAA